MSAAMNEVIFNRSAFDLIVRGMSGPEDQAFTSERHGTFNVTRALPWALDNVKPQLVKLDVPYVLQCAPNIDLDPGHMQRLQQLSDQDLLHSTLLLYIDLEDGFHLLIDGNHRAAELARRASKRGERFMDVAALILTREQAEQFRVRHFISVNGVEREITAEQLLDEISGVYCQPDGTIRDDRHESR